MKLLFSEKTPIPVLEFAHFYVVSMYICRKTRPKMTTEIFVYLFLSALLG